MSAFTKVVPKRKPDKLYFGSITSRQGPRPGPLSALLPDDQAEGSAALADSLRRISEHGFRTLRL